MTTPQHLRQLAARTGLDGIAEALREAASHIERLEAAQNAEPFGYFRALPFGWEQCAESDEGAIALYEHPPASQEQGVLDQPQALPRLCIDDSHMASLIEAAIQGHASTRDAMRWLVRQLATDTAHHGHHTKLGRQAERLIQRLTEWAG